MMATAAPVAALVVTVLGSGAAYADSTCNVVNGKTYGNCTGVKVSTVSKGPLTVRDQQTERGIIAGATVHANAHFTMSGISNGDIRVLSGGELTVTGIVNGSIINEGGTVVVLGTAEHLDARRGKNSVSGVVRRITASERVDIRPGAVVDGVVH